MNRRNVPIVPLVCELDSAVRLNRAMEQMTSWLEFLPDAMAIEAEWRGNPVLAQKLEEERAQQENRPPSAIFLRQARFALALRTLLRRKNIPHVHATSSRALVCALMLKKLLEVTVSGAIEPESELPQAWIRDALSECVGGRLSDPNSIEQRGRSFLFDKATFRPGARRALGQIGQKTGIDLTAGPDFWQEWAEMLEKWCRKGVSK